MNDNALVVFVKNTVEGKVKTRIGNVKGHDVAVDVYQKLLKIASRITQGVDATKIIYYGEQIDRSDEFPMEIFEKKVQVGADLGDRMSHALIMELKHFKKVVLIGSDCPSLSPEILQKAFDSLDNNDLVLGPTFDGGYYLIGCKKFDVTIFNEMIWSSESVLEKTIENAGNISYKVHLLDRLSDVDYWEDWENYLETQ